MYSLYIPYIFVYIPNIDGIPMLFPYSHIFPIVFLLPPQNLQLWGNWGNLFTLERWRSYSWEGRGWFQSTGLKLGWCNHGDHWYLREGWPWNMSFHSLAHICIPLSAVWCSRWSVGLLNRWWGPLVEVLMSESHIFFNIAPFSVDSNKNNETPGILWHRIISRETLLIECNCQPVAQVTGVLCLELCGFVRICGTKEVEMSELQAKSDFNRKVLK